MVSSFALTSKVATVTATVRVTFTFPRSHSSTPPPTNGVFICTNAGEVATVTVTGSVTSTFPRAEATGIEEGGSESAIVVTGNMVER